MSIYDDDGNMGAMASASASASASDSNYIDNSKFYGNSDIEPIKTKIMSKKDAPFFVILLKY